MIMMGKDFENPFGHKNLKGENKMMSTLLNSGVFPGSQGGPLEHIIAAKAIAFGEALDTSFIDYSKQVTLNAKIMADCLIKKGYDIISGGTDNHCMLIDLTSKNISGKQAESSLVQADITANKNMVPFDTKSPFVTSGIRFGTPAITTRGVKENTIPQIVEFIDQVIMNYDNEIKIKDIKGQVNKLMNNYKIFAY
jgi:glycine hydroxymethyltransferase